MPPNRQIYTNPIIMAHLQEKCLKRLPAAGKELKPAGKKTFKSHIKSIFARQKPEPASFPFALLPVEIRSAVYEAYFDDCALTVKKLDFDFSQRRVGYAVERDIDHSLLRTCQWI